MPERSRKKLDFDQVARKVVDRAMVDKPAQATKKPKDSAVVARGNKGGLNRGKARAAKRTPEQRNASAKKAIQARWAKKP
jgi:hypothetical protein